MADNTVLLAIDDHLLPFRRDLCYYLSKPTVRVEPVLAPSEDNPNAPDHQVAHFYGTGRASCPAPGGAGTSRRALIGTGHARDCHRPRSSGPNEPHQRNGGLPVDRPGAHSVQRSAYAGSPGGIWGAAPCEGTAA